MVSHDICTSVYGYTLDKTVSYDLRLSSSRDITKLFHCVVSQP